MRFFIAPGTYRISWEYKGQKDNYLKEFATPEELESQLDRDAQKGYRILQVRFINNPENIRR